MVRTSHLSLVTSPDSERPAAWLATLGDDYSAADIALLTRVVEWLNPRLHEQTVKGGEPAIDHALGVVTLLHGLNLDAECLVAGLLLPTAGRHDALVEIRDKFGARAAELADGVARMALIEVLNPHAARAEGPAQLEGLRKMLLAMAQDVRVVLIKLADHLQSLRYAVKCDDAQLRHDMARLTQDIFAPLANRLGVWQLKWELEDLALRILEPEVYKRIARLLDEKRQGRERYIETAIARLNDEFALGGIKVEVSGRPKHIYSIYNKMRRKAVAFDAVYDVRAVRVLVGDIADCYAALDLVRLLRGARSCAPVMASGARRVRRLHRKAQGQRLSVAAHRGHRR
jgi:GTP pyrophosphokinase